MIKSCCTDCDSNSVSKTEGSRPQEHSPCMGLMSKSSLRKFSPLRPWLCPQEVLLHRGLWPALLQCLSGRDEHAPRGHGRPETLLEQRREEGRKYGVWMPLAHASNSKDIHLAETRSTLLYLRLKWGEDQDIADITISCSPSVHLSLELHLVCCSRPPYISHRIPQFTLFSKSRDSHTSWRSCRTGLNSIQTIPKDWAYPRPYSQVILLIPTISAAWNVEGWGEKRAGQWILHVAVATERYAVH